MMRMAEHNYPGMALMRMNSQRGTRAYVLPQQGGPECILMIQQGQQFQALPQPEEKEAAKLIVMS